MKMDYRLEPEPLSDEELFIDQQVERWIDDIDIEVGDSGVRLLDVVDISALEGKLAEEAKTLYWENKYGI